MAKKVNKPSPRRNRTVRNMPDDLWDRLNKYLARTGKKQYAVVVDAVRQFLDTQESKEGEK
jgi:predicted transcriptional regulator